MNEDTPAEGMPTDPVEQDASIIAEQSAALGRDRARELGDDAKGRTLTEEDRALAEEEQRIAAKRTSNAAERAALDADKAAVQAAEQREEKSIGDALADAERRRDPGLAPSPAPQPPRPRVG